MFIVHCSRSIDSAAELVLVLRLFMNSGIYRIDTAHQTLTVLEDNKTVASCLKMRVIVSLTGFCYSYICSPTGGKTRFA